MGLPAVGDSVEAIRCPFERRRRLAAGIGRSRPGGIFSASAGFRRFEAVEAKARGRGRAESNRCRAALERTPAEGFPHWRDPAEATRQAKGS